MGCGHDVENLFDVVITSQNANVWSLLIDDKLRPTVYDSFDC